MCRNTFPIRARYGTPRLRGAAAPHCASAYATNDEIAAPLNNVCCAVPRVLIRPNDGMWWFEDWVQDRLNGEGWEGADGEVGAEAQCRLLSGSVLL